MIPKQSSDKSRYSLGGSVIDTYVSRHFETWVPMYQALTIECVNTNPVYFPGIVFQKSMAYNTYHTFVTCFLLVCLILVVLSTVLLVGHNIRSGLVIQS
jgi:hypothetical protein